MVRSYAPFSSQDFYPRPPRGGRPLVILRKAVDDGISIHALREEGDRGPGGPPVCVQAHPFLSTPSARRATRSPPTAQK